jgi:hypothetical protein
LFKYSVISSSASLDMLVARQLPGPPWN